jgi:hypothetical protein
MFEEEKQDDERADQWIAGGTLPDADETWTVPPDDPDATYPLPRR